ncbi:MAG: hypothetical protein Q7T54_03790 [Candidatus Levybacteria bacterium]|nr:hypothetical protein [Candidatus Levybacteria bacterium]
MPGSQERDRHEEFQLIPFPGSDDAAQISPNPLEQSVRQPIGAVVFERLQGVHQYALTAPSCFDEDKRGRIKASVLIPHREHNIPSFVPAEAYFANHGISPEEIETLFDRWGTWRFRPYIDDIYSLSASQVNRELSTALFPINNGVDRILDSLNPKGYNKHGIEHPGSVVSIAHRLLDLYPANTHEEQESRKRLASIAGQAHDIGNIFYRDGHGHVSAQMLELLVPSVRGEKGKSVDERWKTIRKTIILHDSDNMQAVADSWGLDGEEKLDKLAATMKPEGLATLIADKVDVGYQRVSDAILAGEIPEDIHAVVNAMSSHNAVEFEGDSLVWKLVYNPEIPDHLSKSLHFIPGWKRRLAEGEIDIPFQNWEKMFRHIYTDRMVTAALCSLALFPFARKFEVQMVDERGNELQENIVVARDSVDGDLDSLRQQKSKLKTS